ncbi:TIGR02757 family protein [Flavobacterium psychrophilum]|uniref:TIGR02757 family protein n=1 Tax=Flavobacterium psychrophilum TaxID=96345 RepID=UPI00141AE4B9|nr:TIGR02757 family protein [Flavobacterium psychrophilum]ELY2010373.1 TIGR02757 family protein [Flavobacterium psychrophilum]MBF2024621.1 TIGR02757 family protein [Flavobacterium psychrophilum]MCB5982811.1 TIGR02757 family protein [Flavobacterium psychrophilum]MCB5994240.1 TIGR02757 family protein [Flavobacterium psychrophilum]MCB5996553.1 TIGR02757 family protein [Flavobacterium psychrophilum]
MNLSELQSFLDEKVILYNNLNFIESDPIQIPHLFSLKEDIEIAGFLSATIAWGNRKMIINNSHKMMQLMGNSPYDFVLSHNENQLESLNKFVHRTFNGQDFVQFIKSLQHIYTNHNGLEAVFAKNATKDSMQKSISEFKKIFFENNHLPRTQKHISDPISGSAAKRINMFLRWMVRQDAQGVDFGLWKTISPSALSCPLDVHSGNVARKLQLLLRKQNDAKAVYELDTNLRLLDPNDPVKYDFALFGLGVFEKF